MNAMDSKPFLLEPPPDFVDPRLTRSFEPEHWPTCNGKPGPPPATLDLYEKRCVEFLAAYYELNRLNVRLLHARKNRASQKEVRALLAKIARKSTALEKLEDRYAPVGFFGDPVMNGIFYRDVAFTRPELPKIYTPAASQSSHIAISGLELIPSAELRGPVRILRFHHAKTKVDI